MIEEPERYNEFRSAAVARAAELGIKLKCPSAYPEKTAEAPAAEVSTSEVPAAACSSPSPASAKVPCTMPTMELYVFYDGRVFPCCHPHAHRRMQVGDLRTQTFAEIWNGKLYQSLRRGLQSGDVPHICRTCSIVHDPPPAYEDDDEATRAKNLADYYATEESRAVDQEIEALPALLRGLVNESLGNLETNIDHLRRYSTDLKAHASTLEEERSHLFSHATTLEAERPQLLQHVATLEEERPQLIAHAERLDYILKKLQGYRAFRFLGGVKSLFVRKPTAD